jgi:hypothetical protein
LNRAARPEVARRPKRPAFYRARAREATGFRQAPMDQAA